MSAPVGIERDVAQAAALPTGFVDSSAVGASARVAASGSAWMDWALWNDSARPEARTSHRRTPSPVPLLPIWDVAVLLAAVWAFGLVTSRSVDSLLRLGVLALVAFGAIGFMHGYRSTTCLYDHPLRMARKLLCASTIVSWCLVAVFEGPSVRARPGALVVCWLALAAAWFVGRRVWAIRRCSKQERVVILGSGEVAARVVLLTRRRRSPVQVVGFVDDELGVMAGMLPHLGRVEALPRIIERDGVDRVIVAFPSRPDTDTLLALRDTVGRGCPVDIVPRLFEFVGQAPPVFYHVDGMPFLSVSTYSLAAWRTALKRGMDISVSAVLLAVLAPLYALLALAIAKDSGRPVLFRQTRVGKDGRRFTILKFRTLRPPSGPPMPVDPAMDAEQLVRANKADAEARATRVGAFLRKSSLDELPQLINVLRGDMSLIGPRPLAEPEYEMLSGWELRRQHMRPGLTGLWQVSGRSETSWSKRMDLDHAQVHHWSLWSDLEILADTVPAIWEQRGAL